MELFPGLPYDMGQECLLRVPYDHLSTVSSVRKCWKQEIQRPEFWRQRKLAGFTRSLIVMVQAQVDLQRRSGIGKYSAAPVYRLTICEPDTGYWTELPLMPGYSDGLPMFCQLVRVGLNLVVIGGWNPDTWQVSKEVFVYSFISAKWRRGADMPGLERSFFACASDSDRTVYVAGGHDYRKNALASALAYDVLKDEWIRLPDMASQRDECKGVFHRGKFLVIGGYHTDMQGRFGSSAEAFDPISRQWDPIKEDFLVDATCPRTCVDAEDGRMMYLCRGIHVAALSCEDNSRWQVVAELPSDVRVTAYVTAWQGKLLVVGSPRYNEAHRVYAWDPRGDKWTKVDVPEKFSGYVQAGCCLEI